MLRVDAKQHDSAITIDFSPLQVPAVAAFLVNDGRNIDYAEETNGRIIVLEERASTYSARLKSIEDRMAAIEQRFFSHARMECTLIGQITRLDHQLSQLRR